VLAAVGKMAARVRSGLGDRGADADQVRVEETFTARSLEAARAYTQAQELQWAGQQREAIQKYEEAVKLDPEFGRAYAGLAAVNANLGRGEDAERYYQLALQKIDRMTDREKYRTRGGYFLFARNAAQAADQFQQLVDRYRPTRTAWRTSPTPTPCCETSGRRSSSGAGRPTSSRTTSSGGTTSRSMQSTPAISRRRRRKPARPSS